MPWIFSLRPLELYIYWNIEEGLAGEGLARDGLAGEEANKVEAQEVPAKAGAVCRDIYQSMSWEHSHKTPPLIQLQMMTTFLFLHHLFPFLQMYMMNL